MAALLSAFRCGNSGQGAGRVAPPSGRGRDRRGEGAPGGYRARAGGGTRAPPRRKGRTRGGQGFPTRRNGRGGGGSGLPRFRRRPQRRGAGAPGRRSSGGAGRAGAPQRGSAETRGGQVFRGEEAEGRAREEEAGEETRRHARAHGALHLQDQDVRAAPRQLLPRPTRCAPRCPSRATPRDPLGFDGARTARRTSGVNADDTAWLTSALQQAAKSAREVPLGHSDRR